MDQLVNFIIRPPRAIYCPQDDLLDQEFMLKGRWFQRKDLEYRVPRLYHVLMRSVEFFYAIMHNCYAFKFTADSGRNYYKSNELQIELVINGRGNKLRCSHYVPLVIPEGQALPCVIYCHGNSGCRADASEAAIILLPSNITVFALDFSGSGLSEGEHVTLGWNEKDDLRAVVDYLRNDTRVSCIGLWGRSMGAVTSLMYGAGDPSIAGMVLDSPFSNLVDLMMELVDTYKYPIPKFTVKLAIQHMRRIIKKKANFDIMDLDAIQAAKCSFVPVLFGHAVDDDFIHPHHSDRVYDSYVGDKNIIKFDGDHNSPRPQFYFDSITIFFHNVLNPPKDVSDKVYSHSMHDILVQDKWERMHAFRNHQTNSGGAHRELAATSTEDTIAQLRSRRPMSRTDVPHDISFKQEQSETEEDGSSGDLGPSSSKLDPVNLPNVRPHDWLTPHAEDDDYLEYSFDDFSDVPCSIEDEERMIMEAMIESLKDLELRLPEEKCNAVTTMSEQSDSKETCSEESSTEPSCRAVDTTSASCGYASSKDTKLHDQGLEETEAASPTDNQNSQVESKKDITVDSSSSMQNADTSTGTRATLVVEKNPTSNFMEELAQRWRINIFKSR